MKKKGELEEIFRDGDRCHGRNVSIFFKQAPGFQRRVAFIATKRVGSAVRKNRFKRLLREVYRRNKERVAEDVHLALVGKSEYRDGYKGLEAEVLDLFKKAKIERRWGWLGKWPRRSFS